MNASGFGFVAAVVMVVVAAAGVVFAEALRDGLAGEAVELVPTGCSPSFPCLPSS
jgi:hypothetical protein